MKTHFTEQDIQTAKKYRKDVQDTHPWGDSVKTRTASHPLHGLPPTPTTRSQLPTHWKVEMKGMKRPSVTIIMLGGRKHQGPRKPVQALPQDQQCPSIHLHFYHAGRAGC